MLRGSNLEAMKPVRLNRKYPGGWIMREPSAMAFTWRNESAK